MPLGRHCIQYFKIEEYNRFNAVALKALCSMISSGELVEKGLPDNVCVSSLSACMCIKAFCHPEPERLVRSGPRRRVPRDTT